MHILCSDLEGVFVPEVWINVAKKTGIEELKLTTRDISDYDVLMTRRLKILKEHNLTLKDIQDVIATIEPLEGAKEFLDFIRTKIPLVVVSDTFQEFADPLMAQLGRPTLLCHSLTTDANGMITHYNLRQKDPKRKVVEALQSLTYKIIAMGDSYNDTSMLQQAEHGILFSPPQNVIDEFPQFPVVTNYVELKTELAKIISI
ncbi:MAG: bifunctional phosphoserine phosphatase/homoserine phosphotransferase ThrH [Bacteroidales bacterium]|nr:bifunctional phosphoserine phosphatase/homoserine phosphotransferase ThrH [Bacteroidales bacterium]MCF8455852.1 bifunctional phosphoserine phosphatase/homoserine phosphotransferase ThrH [Bacteroidales bacterium]